MDGTCEGANQGGWLLNCFGQYVRPKAGRGMGLKLVIVLQFKMNDTMMILYF